MRLLTAAALLALAAACTPMTTAEMGAGMGATTEAGAINMQRSMNAEFTMMGPFPVVEGGFRP